MNYYKSYNAAYRDVLSITSFMLNGDVGYGGDGGSQPSGSDECLSRSVLWR